MDGSGRAMMCALAATLALTACASRPPAPPSPAPAPESYTAETTYAKLAPAYPFIRIASRAVPPTVRAITNVTYVRRAGHDLQLDLYLPAAAATAPRPAIVFVHGGGWRAGVRANFAPMAIRMAERGYAAATISYRLAGEARYPAAIHDAKAAVRWVRAHAAEYGVDPQRVGVMGFSAGGELVSLVADNPEPPQRGPADALDRLSARPDFQVLVYPGDAGTPAQAVDKAPPAFLVAGSRDACCLAPSLTLYQQLVKAGVSAELHLYADTDHAFNMGQRGERVSLQHWPDRLSDWLSDGGWLVPRNGRKPEGVPAP